MSQVKVGTEQEEKETTQQEESKPKQDDEEASGNLNIQTNLTDEDKILVDKDTKEMQEKGKTFNVPGDEKADNDDAGQQTQVSNLENTQTGDVKNSDSKVTNPENTQTDDINNTDSIIQNSKNSAVQEDPVEEAMNEDGNDKVSEDDENKFAGKNLKKQEKEETQKQQAFITEESNNTPLEQENSFPIENKEQKVDDKKDDQLHADKSDDRKELGTDTAPKSESNDDHDEPKSEIRRHKSQSSNDDEDVQIKETEPIDIVHADHHDDSNYGAKYDGLEEGTMEIDDEVVHHETRDRKYSSASSSTQLSKSSTKSDIKGNKQNTNDTEKDQLRKTDANDNAIRTDKTGENSDSDDDVIKTDKTRQNADTDDGVIKNEVPEVKPSQSRIEPKSDCQTTDKKAANVHYDVKTNNNKNKDKRSSPVINSPARENNSSNRHAHRGTTQSAQFRRPVHTSDSPKGKSGPFLRRRPKTTDTRILPSRGAEKQKKNYFHEELRRLKTRLDTEAKSEKRPEEREYYPYTFTTMGPYCDTHTAEFLICMPDEELQPQRPVSRGRSDDKNHGYVSRNTAIGLCDPWVDLQMDREILPRLIPPKQAKDKGKETPFSSRRSARRVYSRSAPPRQQTDYNAQKKKLKEKRAKEGSTRLPKFPVVPFNTNKENATKMFPYSDVKKFREEYREKYSTYAQKRIEQDYKKTKQDFYRMDLDKLDEIHPLNRQHMRKTYFAYLQNTPGSRKAVTECVKELYPNSSEEKPGSAPQPAVHSPQQTAQEAN